MEAELKFERENRNGIGVVGSYLIDAARRLGVEIRDESGRLGLDDSSAVTVKSGAEFLSAPTKAEKEQLTEERRANGERLASQAKIEKAGEIVILTSERKEEPVIDPNEEYRKEFAELPLEAKIANLVKLESMALSETINFVLNSPYAIGGKIVDVLAQFGFKIDEEAKKTAQPEEHEPEEAKEAETAAQGKSPRKKKDKI
jgi:ferredoxin